MIGDILSQALNKSLFGVEDTTTGLLGSTLTRAIPTLAGSRGSSSKSMWTSLGTGLLAGLLGGIGERQANAQNADLYAQAQGLYGATPEQRANVVRENPRLANYATALGATELQQQQAIKQKQLEAQILRENEKYKANLALPKEAIGALGTAGASPATILQAVEKARAGESLTSALLGGQVVNPSAEITDAQVEAGLMPSKNPLFMNKDDRALELHRKKNELNQVNTLELEQKKNERLGKGLLDSAKIATKSSNKLFEEAKERNGITSGSFLGLNRTEDAQAFRNYKTRMYLELTKVAGKSISDSEASIIDNLTPTAWDNDEMIEKKRKDWEEFLTTRAQQSATEKGLDLDTAESSPTKTINGMKYKKVNGGWEVVG